MTYAFTVSVGTYDMQFNDRGAAERAATQYGTTVTENYESEPTGTHQCDECGWEKRNCICH